MNPRIASSLACLLLIFAGCAPEKPSNVAFQTSTIPALMEGVYDGDISLADVRKQGDLGIGTLNNLDGELILLDGNFYQVRSDGRAYRPSLSASTPLAIVCFFKPQTHTTWDVPLNYEQLRACLDQLRPSANIPYAIRITGEFDLVTTRSVPRQEPPFRRLIEVTKEQPTFELKKTTGTLVGFWFPQYLQGLNVPGYHLHYLTSDYQSGGHVLDCRPKRVTVEIAELPDLAIRLPRTTSFRVADLQQDRPGELHKVEQAPAATMPR